MTRNKVLKVCTKCCRAVEKVRNRWVHADDQTPLCFGAKIGEQPSLPLELENP